jgi:ABC-type polysaccharide/polyol phosphate transport system ATPase subunit
VYPIEVKSAGKKFRVQGAGRQDKIKTALINTRSRSTVDEFWALRDISVRVAAGSMLGIIGANGAGKSTLLRMLGGLYRPDEGEVNVQGHIVGFLELGAGFHGDLTGRRNIFVNGVVCGLTRAEIQRKFDDIVAFSGLEQFIDFPLRTYSKGMRLRLGFSIIAHTEPDILLVDEALAVGDRQFHDRCLERIKQFRNSGTAIVLASHGLEAVIRHCDEAILLREGCIIESGAAEKVVERYIDDPDGDVAASPLSRARPDFKSKPLTRFAIAGYARTGSNYVSAALASAADVKMHTEIFAAHNRQPGTDYKILLSRLYESVGDEIRALGFKLFYNHFTEEEWSDFSGRAEFRIIHLTRRNRLRRMVSEDIATKTGQWVLTDIADKKRAEKIWLDPDTVIERIVSVENRESWFREQFSEHAVLEVVYEDMMLNMGATFKAITGFLGIEALQPRKVHLLQQNPEPLSELIENYSDIQEMLKNTPYHHYLY